MNEALYRFFDKDGQLLYVGVSSNWQQRLKQHYKESLFHWEAATITLEHFDTRESVEEAEKLAIQTENPKYNKALNPNFETATDHLIKIKFWVYSKIEPDKEHAGIVKELQSLFLADKLWTNKTAGPISYYLLENLPVWAEKYGTDCDSCLRSWHSAQIDVWADSFRRKIAAN